MPRDESESADVGRVGDGSSAARSGDGSSDLGGTSIRWLARLLDRDEDADRVLLQLQPGDILADRFVVERLVQSGGMGRVYRGTDRLIGAAVAIKVVGPRGHATDDRFKEEARVLAQLR